MTAPSALQTTTMPSVKGRFWSRTDLQRHLKHCRFSARKQAFGAECLQSAGERTFIGRPNIERIVRWTLQDNGDELGPDLRELEDGLAEVIGEIEGYPWWAMLRRVT